MNQVKSAAASKSADGQNASSKKLRRSATDGSLAFGWLRKMLQRVFKPQEFYYRSESENYSASRDFERSRAAIDHFNHF